MVGVDTGFYRSGWLYNGDAVTVETLKDIRAARRPPTSRAVDAVVHMAELSNDPLGAARSHVTYEINHQARCTSPRSREGRRASSASSTRRRAASTARRREDSSTKRRRSTRRRPTPCKLLVERDVGAMAGDDFSPTFLRNATAFGASPRMRFDIVLNNLCGLAWTTKEIRMESDGTPWRPLVHVLDICKAIACALEAPRERVHDEVLNVGDPAANYQIREVAEIVGARLPGLRDDLRLRGRRRAQLPRRVRQDPRGLPGFRCDWDAELGAQQLLDVFRASG